MSKILGVHTQTAIPWTSYSPPLTNCGNATATGSWRQVGQNAQVRVHLTIGSSFPTGSILVGMPSGAVIDNSVPGMRPSYAILGQAGASQGTAQYHGMAIQDSTNNRTQLIGPAGTVWNNTAPYTWSTAGEVIEITLEYPAVGFKASDMFRTSDNSKV